MRLSETKVNEVREMFMNLAKQQADMFCTTFETFAQQLPPSVVSEDQALAMFNSMLGTVKDEYQEMIKDTEAAVNEKVAASISKITDKLKEGKHED